MGENLIPVGEGDGNLVFFTEWINVLAHPNNRHKLTYLVRLQLSIMPQPPSEMVQSPTPIYPPPLQPGDCLAVLAPSGALRELESFKQGIALWRSWGFDVDVPAAVSQKWGYLAGRDKERRQAWIEALTNPDYKAILCARGG
jgi:hypothetical protein